MIVKNPFYYIMVKTGLNEPYKFVSVNRQTSTDSKEFALAYPTAAQAYKAVAMFQNIQPEKLFGVLRIMEDEEVGEV